MTKENKDEIFKKVVSVRLNVEEYYEIKRRAMLYCNGQMSTYMRYASRYYTVNQHDIVDGTPRAVSRRLAKEMRGGLTVKAHEKKIARKRQKKRG